MQVDEAVHVSSQTWNPERPETLMICCSDGRYHQHFEDFVPGRVSERPDFIALPGGPAQTRLKRLSREGAKDATCLEEAVVQRTRGSPR